MTEDYDTEPNYGEDGYIRVYQVKGKKARVVAVYYDGAFTDQPFTEEAFNAIKETDLKIKGREDIEEALSEAGLDDDEITVSSGMPSGYFKVAI